MNYVLLVVSVLLGTGKNMVSKSAGDKFSGFNNLLKTNIITALVGISVFSITGFGIDVLKNPLPLLLGVFYGIFTMLSQMLFIKAVEYSATAVCSLIYSMGFILPTFFSVFVYKETFGLQKFVAFLLMLVAFVLVSKIKKGSSNKIYFAFLAMLSSGVIGIIQKLISKVKPVIPISQYLIVAFAVMFIVSVIGLFVVGNKGENQKAENKNDYLKFICISITMGVCVSFANNINTKLAGLMPAVIFFTCVNGGTILLSAIFSKLLFKEKIKPIQTLGIGIGILAIILMVL